MASAELLVPLLIYAFFIALIIFHWAMLAKAFKRGDWGWFLLMFIVPIMDIFYFFK